jgi:hypothetical protein
MILRGRVVVVGIGRHVSVCPGNSHWLDKPETAIFPHSQIGGVQ